MKVTLGARPDIKCPYCGAKPTIETGFWASFLVAAFLDKLEKEGGIVTCWECKKKYEVKGSNS